MLIKGLGYLGIASSHLDDWDKVATGILGMERTDSSRSALSFRMDSQAQRLSVHSGAKEGLAFMGWEVEGPVALQAIAARIEKAGIAVQAGDAALRDQRQVSDLIFFTDPDGHRVEVFHTALSGPAAFAPARPISGFLTESLGMGHIVLNSANAGKMLEFYRDVLGFSVSDYGKLPYQLYFFHVNGRHHSFALVEAANASCHHFMIELQALDDVGQGYDLAQMDEGRVAYTLGRHINDHMFSFYLRSPSGFFIEYGWGGKIIDPQSWKPHEIFDGPSYWGHDRLYMTEPQRSQIRAITLDVARRGLRSP